MTTNSDTGQYQGSQAFAHLAVGNSDNESVNLNTGSLNFSKPLVNLRGKRDTVNLVVNLSYSFGSLGVFGMPSGWSLGLPHVIPDVSVTVSDRTYAIDPNWSDSTGYQSGLRYVNDHGISFRKVIPPQPLPSGNSGHYSFKLQLSDGSADYFDAGGRPMEHDDLFGNYLSYSYAGGSGNDPTTARLSSIVDSWGQTVQFKYQPGTEMIIVGADNSQTTVTLAAEGVLQVTDAAGLETTFSYSIFASTKQVLSKITYPTGLVSTFDFMNMAFINTSGETDFIPAVQDFRRLDQNSNVLENITYRFGTLSGGRTYTGASVGCKMGGLQDALMEGNEQTASYEYDVLKISCDENGKMLAQSSTFFNFLHLPLYEEKFNVDGNTATPSKAYRADFTYDIPFDVFARSTNYAKPVVTVHSHMLSSGSYEPLSRATAAYNEFGNQTSLVEDMYVSATGYVKQRTTTKQYTTTQWGIQMPQLEVVRDEVLGSELHTQHTLSADEKTINMSSISFLAPSNTGGTPIPWKQLQYTYDSNGRQLSQSVSWAPGVNPPDGSPPSTATTSAYAFTGGVLAVSSTDANNNITVVNYDVSLPAGPVVLKTMPLGQTESSQYDALGRLVVYTDPLGNKKTTVYTVGSSGNTVMVTDSLGYTTLTTLDAMGRTTQVADNGDPTQVLTQPTRCLKQKSYDTLSRVKQETDALGLTTSYLHDAMGRPVQVTDPDGNVFSQAYDDGQLTVTERINGDLRSVSQLDGLSRVVSETQYPDSGDSSATISLTMEYIFDGSNRKTRQTASQQPLAGSSSSTTVIMDTTVEYDAGSFIVTETQTGTRDEGGQDVVTRHFTPDLFGNTYTYQKQTTYSDGRSLANVGPVKLYDACNQLVTLRDQLGRDEQRLYDANGWTEKLTRIDGTEIQFSHDAAGQLTQIATPTLTTNLVYACIGRRSSVKQGDSSIAYAYALDGTLTSVDYGDGRTQAFTLDSTSRVVKDIDVLGTARQTTYDTLGHVASTVCNGDTFSYTRGTANHTNGQLLGVTLQSGGGTSATDYSRAITYDGFGQLARETVTPAAGSGQTKLLDTVYVRNARQQLLSLQSTSDASVELNVQHDYLYDGVGQLIQDKTTTKTTTSTAKYTYDGNANLASVAVDGSTPTVMTYNAVDQRADPGFTYDANGRLMTDGDGWQYTFDDKDRLLSVQRIAPAAESVFSYHADDLLAQRQGGQGSKSSAATASDMYYYSGDIINAIETTDAGGSTTSSSLVSDGSQLVSSYNTSSPPSYLLAQQGSTALVLGGNAPTTLTFSPYGLPSGRPAPTATTNTPPFGYRQEYDDSATGLVYLRSRWYSPSHPAFISKDTALNQENRYAYCTGDPVNLFDPSGRVPAWITFGIGLAAGLVTGGIGFLAAGALGAGAVVASIAAVTVGSAGASVASHAADAAMEGQHYGVGDALVDAGTGAFGGLIAGSVIAFTGGTALGLVVAGAAGSFAQGVVAQAAGGHGLHAGALALDAIVGGIMGLATAGAVRWGYGSWRASAGIDDDGDGATAPRARRNAFYQARRGGPDDVRVQVVNGTVVTIRLLGSLARGGANWAAMLRNIVQYCWDARPFRGFSREPDPGDCGGGGLLVPLLPLVRRG